FYVSGLANAGADLVHARAELRDAHTIELIGKGQTVTADKILIAVGGWPVKPDVPGAEFAITSNEAFHLETLPKSILIVGGGYIAVEFAGIFNGLGSEVVLNYRGPLFLRGFDDDVRNTLAAEMRNRGIDLRFDTVVNRLEKRNGRVVADLSTGDTVEADLMLCATGRVPNTAGLGLEEIGVELDARGAIIVDDFLESSAPGVYALGDVIDRIALTPVALAEGMAFVETAFKKNPTTVDYTNVPSAVFSQPPVGTVGLTEFEARTEGFDVVIYRSTFRPMANTMSGRDERTMMKLVVDRPTDRVLGVHMVGPDAGEIIQGIAIALKAGATKKTFDRTIGIHPTAAEEFVTMRTPVG
ncbi:MAG: FAD-dependent oxidoreductase, partial [Thermoanaerobaculales bacterium]|nr:FAD-dependent oxidoreductase [Thermoanaerobaculales bacterium]